LVAEEDALEVEGLDASPLDELDTVDPQPGVRDHCPFQSQRTSARVEIGEKGFVKAGEGFLTVSAEIDGERVDRQRNGCGEPCSEEGEGGKDDGEGRGREVEEEGSDLTKGGVGEYSSGRSVDLYVVAGKFRGQTELLLSRRKEGSSPRRSAHRREAAAR